MTNDELMIEAQVRGDTPSPEFFPLFSELDHSFDIRHSCFVIVPVAMPSRSSIALNRVFSI